MKQSKRVDRTAHKMFVKWTASGYKDALVNERPNPKDKKKAVLNLEPLPHEKRQAERRKNIKIVQKRKTVLRVPERSGICRDDAGRAGYVFRQYPDLAQCNHVNIEFETIGG